MSLGSRLLNQCSKPSDWLGRLTAVESRRTVSKSCPGPCRTCPSRISGSTSSPQWKPHYYWPDLNADMREVLRVLKPGATLIIIAEAYKGGKYDRLLRNLERLQGMMRYAHLTVGEHRELLSEAGYTDVQLFEEYDKGWLCAVGRKRV